MSLATKIRGIRDIWHFDNRWELLLNRLFFPGKNLLIYRGMGVEFLTDHAAGDANGARELLTSPMYSQYIAQMELPSTINVIDLGSNNGGFPLLLKSRGFSIDKLLCVEMNPNTFSRLRSNLERNFGDNFTAVNCAVRGEVGELAVNLGTGSAGDSIYRASSESVATYQLQARTFDELYDEVFGDSPVDVCKIDIEGAEFEMIRSPNAGRIGRCRYILIEIHHDATHDRREVLQRLADAGFVEIGGENKIGADKHYVHFLVKRDAV